MAINLQKLIDEIQARLNTSTGSTPVSDLSRLSKISSTINDLTSSITSYPGLSNFPVADSSNHGDIVYSLDSGAYRISEQLAWREITLNADSVIAAVSTSTQAQGSTSGYASGGYVTPLTSVTNIIDKFPFSSDANATDVGDLSVARAYVAGQSSSASGYTSGGFSPTVLNTIDKFPFVSDGNATDVGDMTVTRYGHAGQSSTASGYNSGGFPIQNTIDKFPFSSDANATDVGDLTASRRYCSGQSSADNGYTSSGFAPGPPTPYYDV